MEYKSIPSSQQIEQEYRQMYEQKDMIKKKSIINLTSENLKKEYTKKINLYNKGLYYTFFISSLIIICSFIEFKYIGPSETIVLILIMSCMSSSFCFLLIVNLKAKALIDTYGYAAFYLFSMIESFLFLCLLMIKILDIILIYKRLNEGDCKSKYNCPTNFAYLLILIINVIIFLGNILTIKFNFDLFLDSFNILILKKKTFFQRQIEINESKSKEKKNDSNNEKEKNINNNLKSLNAKIKHKKE